MSARGNWKVCASWPRATIRPQQTNSLQLCHLCCYYHHRQHPTLVWRLPLTMAPAWFDQPERVRENPDLPSSVFFLSTTTATAATIMRLHQCRCAKFWTRVTHEKVKPACCGLCWVAPSPDCLFAGLLEEKSSPLQDQVQSLCLVTFVPKAAAVAQISRCLFLWKPGNRKLRMCLSEPFLASNQLDCCPLSSAAL